MTVETVFDRRVAPGLALADAADQVAQACHDMAERFHRGGTLIAFGEGEAAADAAHLAVEFVHPVIVGKRALPAVSLANDPLARSSGTGTFAAQLRLTGRPDDIAVAIATGEPTPQVHEALRAAREVGMLTVALTAGPADADHLLTAQTEDPLVAREIHVTTYHILWELVHVFLDRTALRRAR